MRVSPASLARLYEEDFKQDMAALKVGGWREGRAMEAVWRGLRPRGAGETVGLCPPAGPPTHRLPAGDRARASDRRLHRETHRQRARLLHSKR